MKKIKSIMIIMAFLLSCGFSNAEQSVTCNVKRHYNAAIDGNHVFILKGGERYLLRGVSISELEQEKEPTWENMNALIVKSEKIGVNCIRVPLKLSRLVNTSEPENVTLDPVYWGLVTQTVQKANDLNMAVILDMHNINSILTNISDQSHYTETCQLLIKNAWGRITENVKDFDNVIGFDLLNNPSSLTPVNIASIWKELANDIIKSIREHDTERLIFVNGFISDDWLDISDPAKRLVFTAAANFSTYTDLNEFGKRNILENTIKSVINWMHYTKQPVVFTSIGFNEVNPKLEPVLADLFSEYLNHYGLGAILWAVTFKSDTNEKILDEKNYVYKLCQQNTSIPWKEPFYIDVFKDNYVKIDEWSCPSIISYTNYEGYSTSTCIGISYTNVSDYGNNLLLYNYKDNNKQEASIHCKQYETLSFLFKGSGGFKIFLGNGKEIEGNPYELLDTKKSDTYSLVTIPMDESFCPETESYTIIKIQQIRSDSEKAYIDNIRFHKKQDPIDWGFQETKNSLYKKPSTIALPVSLTCNKAVQHIYFELTSSTNVLTLTDLSVSRQLSDKHYLCEINPIDNTRMAVDIHCNYTPYDASVVLENSPLTLTYQVQSNEINNSELKIPIVFSGKINDSDFKTYTASVVFDNKPPEPIEFSVDENVFYSKITWSWQSEGGGVSEYSISSSFADSFVTSYTTYQSDEISNEGAYTLCVQERDDAFNWSEKICLQKHIDRTPPVASFTFDGGTNLIGECDSLTKTYITTRELKISAHILDENEIKSIAFSNDGEIYTQFSNNDKIRWDLTENDGNKTVYMKCNDIAGNTSTVYTSTIYLDQTPPKTILEDIQTDKSISFRYTTSDACGSGIKNFTYKWYRNNEDEQTGETITPTDDHFFSFRDYVKYEGLYHFTIDSTDQLSNYGNTQEYTFIYDYTGPSVNILSSNTPEIITLTTRSFSIHYTVSDTYSNISEVTLEVHEPGGYTSITQDISDLCTFAYSGYFQYTASVAGIYQYTITAKDNLSNKSNSKPFQTTYLRDINGYAILIAGDDKNNQESFYYSAENVYNHLVEHNFTYGKYLNDQKYKDPYDLVQFFTPDTVDSPDQTISTSYSKAITEWAYEKMINAEAPLYIVLAGHGNQYTYNESSENPISYTNLANWVGTLNKNLSQHDINQPVIVITGACEGGQYLKNMEQVLLSNYPQQITNTILISSTNNLEKDVLDFRIHDNNNEGIFFITELFYHLSLGKTIRSSFEAARDETLMYQNEKQHPQMISRSDFDDITLGNAITDSDTTLTVSQYDIQDRYIDLSTTLTFQVHSDHEDISAWLQVKPIAGDGSYTITFDDHLSANLQFSDTGIYAVFCFVHDRAKDTRYLADSWFFYVKDQNAGDACRPSPVTLSCPSENCELTRVVFNDHINFLWSDYNETNKNISYILEIKGDKKNIFENIKNEFYPVSISNFISGKKYSWQVTSVSECGDITISEEHEFTYVKTANDNLKNDWDIVVALFIKDSLNHDQITNPNIHYYNETKRKNPYEIFFNNGETVDFNINAKGYNLLKKSITFDSDALSCTKIINSHYKCDPLYIFLQPVYTVSEDTALTLTSTNFHEQPTKESSCTDLVSVENIKIADQKVIITPEINQSGTTTITISDSSGLTVSIFQLNVTPVNDRPEISEIQTLTICNNSPGNITFTVSDVDDDLNELSIQAASSNITLISNDSITYTCTSNNVCQLSVTSTDNLYGKESTSLTLTVTATDKEGASTGQHFNVNIMPILDMNNDHAITLHDPILLLQFLADFNTESIGLECFPCICLLDKCKPFDISGVLYLLNTVSNQQHKGKEQNEDQL
jgi:hypothetical protein